MLHRNSIRVKFYIAKSKKDVYKNYFLVCRVARPHADSQGCTQYGLKTCLNEEVFEVSRF